MAQIGRASGRESAGVWLGLAGLGALAYGMLPGAPVLGEDAYHIWDNPFLRLPAREFWTGLLGSHYFQAARERTYQPLVTALHYLLAASPAAVRAAGIAAHCLNAGLVFLLGVRLLRRRDAALAAAALFLLFPCAGEAVAISSYHGHVFSLGFALGSLLLWARSLDRFPGGRAAAAGSWLLFALGLACKETGLVVLALVPLYTVCFGRGCRRRAAPRALPFALIALAYLWLRFGALVQPAPFPRTFSYSPATSFGWYLRMLLAPHPLCLESSAPAGWLYWALPGVFAGALWAARRSAWASFCLWWLLICLLPVLHIVAFANLSPVADRYLYWPVVGFCLLAGALARWRPGRAALAGLILAWGAVCIARNGLYRQPRLLYEQTARCAAGNPRAHFLLGQECLRGLDLDASERAFRRVLELTDSAGTRAALDDIARLRRAGYPAAGSPDSRARRRQ
ncbi:MAG: hypothetical protein PHF00_08455 [Elusimicrobia bacterium]|nr:hypothetical protein [Elusimicrobiota bacterium]